MDLFNVQSHGYTLQDRWVFHLNAKLTPMIRLNAKMNAYNSRFMGSIVNNDIQNDFCHIRFSQHTYCNAQSSMVVSIEIYLVDVIDASKGSLFSGERVRS